MKSRFMALAILLNMLIFSNQLHADVNVLVIGCSKDSGERHHAGVRWNSVKPAFIPNSKPFSPSEVGTQLQNILAQDGRGTVNVTVLDRYRTDPIAQLTDWTAYSYNLATWFHYPYPAGAETARWANLRGQAGTVWDYVVLIGDPYTMEYTPGMYAHGVAKIAEEVAKGSAELVLLMPWPGSGSSSAVNHYKEVVYRTGRSGGFKVAPGALAWQACGSPTATAHPSTAGAFIAAASIYSSIYNQSAAASGYVYNDAYANTTFTTYTNNNSASQYTGTFGFQNPYKIIDDKRRDVIMSEKGTSTEQGIKEKVGSAVRRSMVTYDDTTYAVEGHGGHSYNSNTPDDDGLGWDTTKPMPIAFNLGRDGFTVDPPKGYVLNPSRWQLGFGFYYQLQVSSPIETLNDMHIVMMQEQDNDLANRMLNEDPTARNIPVRSLWAQIHKEYPTLSPMQDTAHVSDNLHEASGSYLYTIYSGRCPLDPKPAVNSVLWTSRKIGYETAWRLGRCQSRAPGFKVMPSLATKKTIVPGEKETMTVQFILPPQQDVTVNVSVSNSNAAIVGSNQLVFTPQNYNIPQNVTVAGLPGSAAGESFNVVYTTSSTDEVYDALGDSWDYTINRSAPVTLTRVNKATNLVTAYQNLPLTINLNTAGASSTTTTLAGPSHGTATWSGSNVIYTPGSDFTGKDGFTFATNNAGILTVGYVDITVSASVPNGMISYRGNGNDGGVVPIDSASYAQNATVTVLGNIGNLIRTGYNFTGWNTVANGSGTAYSASATFPMGASGVILYAQWISVPTYTVTYNANSGNSGTVPVSQLKTNGVNLTLAANTGVLAKIGYTFVGWNTATNGMGVDYAEGGTYSANANITLYAKWTLNNYTVTFNANGGGTPSFASKIVTYGSTYGALAAISRDDGFVFNGWFTAATGGTQIQTTTTYNTAGDQTLYAQWIPSTAYNVSYHANGATSGTVPADQRKLEDVTLTLATNSGGLARTNYTFSGWNTVANGSGTAYAVGASYTANAAVTLYAQWALNTYSVSYSGNGSAGGAAPSSQTKTHGIDLTLSGAGALIRPGYTFVNWNTAANGSGTAYSAGAVYSNDATVTLYAQWTNLPTYTITYNGNGNTGGATPSNQTKVQGINLTLSGAGALVRTGYAFANWNTAANGSGTTYAAGATYSTDAAVTLYAQWTLLPTHTITYNGNGSTGGAAPSNQTKTQGIALTLSGAGALVRTGYTFSNWNTAADGSGTSYAAGATYSNDVAVTLHAQWAVSTYVITYNGNGSNSGTAPTNQTKTHGIAINLAANSGGLTKTGYTFAGWNTATNGLGANHAAGASYTVNEALTLYAKWTANNYTVTYNANGGVTPTPTSHSVTYDSTYGALATTSRTGYTFNGWFTAASGGTRVTSGTTVAITSAQTLHAQWTLSSYTVTFNANEGNTPSPASKSVTYASTYGTLANCSRAGYIFNGWYTASSGGSRITSGTTVAITSDQTLYAQWTLGVLLTWDANGTGAGQTNGAGTWAGTNLWWNGTANANWQTGASARFGGLNTAGDAVTLAGPTTVENFTFDQFTGTYTLGTAGQAITINSGINKTATSGVANIISPVVLGANQTWTNNSSSVLTTTNGTNLINNAGYQLTVDGPGNTTFGVISNDTLALTGSGGLVKNGSGMLSIGGANTGFTGDVAINSGTLRTFQNVASLGNGNLSINGGALEFYWGFTYTRTLGAGVGQVRIPGGVSGFSQNGSGGIIRLNNSSAFEAVWGGAHFNPSEFVLNANTAQAGASMTFDNPIDLNGATRIIRSDATTTAVGSFARVIRTSTGTAGLIKTGPGIIALSAPNTYNGDTTISSGTLRIGNNTAGTLGNGNYAGNISIASGANLQIWSTATQILRGTISGDGGLHKSHGGTLTLSGPNTYTGRTSFLPQTTTGCTVYITSFNSVNGGTPLMAGSSLGAPTTIANGTIDIGSGSVQADVNLTYTGPGETTDRVINFGFNGVASQTLTASGRGLLKFTSAMTGNPITTQSGTFNLGGTGIGEITQALPALPSGGLLKYDPGTWTLGGANSYTGPTAVTAGKLFLNGNQSLATGDVTVSANATLGGTGTIGGNTTIANNGKLEFNLGTTAASHDPLDFVAGKGLTFSGASVLTITVTSGATPGLYTLVTGGNNITFSSLPTVILPPGWAADAPTISGNKLQIKITSTNAAYTLWATTGSFTNTFTDITSTGNPDSDNLTNLQEFAFGTDPTLSNFAPLSYLSNGTANPGFPILENTGTPQSPIFHAIFSRRKNHATAGITYDVQFSANLQYWKTSLAGMTVLSGTSTTDVEAVSVPFPASVPTSAAETEFAVPKFFRIGVSED